MSYSFEPRRPPGDEFLLANERPADSLSAETLALIDAFCKQAPNEAFAFGVGVLSRVAETMQSIVDETRRDLIEIEVRRKQIDRVQERTRKVLNELTGHAQ